ncbi:MAG: crosslink repair DNA glycosylase YcaQ family protein [Castellaniella sp.]|uniref:winged helix-turn-helix domain-containing protein n=1 Tax=Castellaniella sp. TaxID=1955812 RepID=UPI003C77F01F
MPSQTLSLAQARKLHLAAQGLLSTPRRKATRQDLRRCIERMQLLQIDTIHVVARSPYLVLFSRLGAYPPAWLDAALAEGHVFETWAHEACFAPTADVPLHRSYNQQARSHWGLKRAQDQVLSHRPQLDALLAHIDAHGPVKSSDFERQDGQSGGWWGWKDEKRWLETLFATGELMVARRDKFQRVYDLSHRVCPSLADAPVPDAAEVHAQFIAKAVLALGITQARWINDYFRQKPRLKDADLDMLVARGVLQRVAVQGWSSPGYVHRQHADLLQQTLDGHLRATHTTLLSPFDPLVWDRERASALWGFDYRIECYTPEEKRTYGYFVLPILHRGALVGRLDAKAHRTQGVFEIKALFLEQDITLDEAALHAVAQAIQRCADWHGTPEVCVQRTEPAALLSRLQAAVRLGSSTR